VFANGFIYTCSHQGLAAYELVEQDHSYYPGDRIDLDFPWRRYWERHRMCLDYVCWPRYTVRHHNVLCTAR
jgi:hypothetical protein